MAEVQELEDIGEIEAVEQQQQQVEVKDSEEDIPEEFRGKSVADLVGMTIHARREMGRQANELGEIRKLADELIKSQLKPKEQEVQPKEIDFFENPQEAISRAVSNHPDVQAAKLQSLHAQQALAKQKLHELHPDFQNIVQDQEFGKWVMSSPVRQQLLQQADKYDLNAAHELFSTFKELKAVKVAQQQREVTTTEQKARDKTMQAAAVDTGGSGEATKKVYRRADLIRLKMTDPARYDAMNDEILAAYSEGRVR